MVKGSIFQDNPTDASIHIQANSSGLGHFSGSLSRQQLEVNVRATTNPLPGEVIDDFLQQRFKIGTVLYLI